ncbi:hypothetical protein CYMTET_19862 [Cymbomonas tetramitiformis]|uniref:Uncharacterized protein n=1 Tax=Cymbomonas tetramitiformis TaxID=36881 RepID=A0AAE0L4W0_9CHLO|nr:hypothetical protein CYMTET_19862 [Cymbomonas tetramitiformis]
MAYSSARRRLASGSSYATGSWRASLEVPVSIFPSKGGVIPRDVVEVLLKFGIKPSPHDEKGVAGDHHDRILAMHLESIAKLLALPTNAEKKIKEEDLQHDATSIMEEGLLVWLPVHHVKLSKNASKVFAGLKVQTSKEAAERVAASLAAKAAREKGAKENLVKAKRKKEGSNEAEEKKKRKKKAAEVENNEQTEEVVEAMEETGDGVGADIEEDDDGGKNDGNGDEDVRDEGETQDKDDADDDSGSGSESSKASGETED